MCKIDTYKKIIELFQPEIQYFYMTGGQTEVCLTEADDLLHI